MVEKTIEQRTDELAVTIECLKNDEDVQLALKVQSGNFKIEIVNDLAKELQTLIDKEGEPKKEKETKEPKVVRGG